MKASLRYRSHHFTVNKAALARAFRASVSTPAAATVRPASRRTHTQQIEMGNKNSKNAARDAGMDANCIAAYYDSVAKFRAECADDLDSQPSSSEVVESDNSNEDNATNQDNHKEDGLASAKANENQVSTNETTAHLEAVLRALDKKDHDALVHAVGALAKFKQQTTAAAKRVRQWAKEHPWEAAAILVPLLSMGFVLPVLGLVGFTSTGIGAGSIAAGFQAWIGNVAAGSVFATLTSAAMGGYGLLAVIGGAGVVPAVALGAVAVWKRWWGGRDAKDKKE